MARVDRIPRRWRRRRAGLDSAGFGGRERDAVPHFHGRRNTVAGEVAPVRNSFDAEIDVSYEIDLWRRIANLQAAARADLFASEFARDATRISVVASVASAYFSLRSLDQQLVDYGAHD